MVPMINQRLGEQFSLPAPTSTKFVDYHGEGDKKNNSKNKSQYQGKKT
jgi:hypothetical protein